MVAPVLEDAGFELELPRGAHRDMRLLETRSVGGGVVGLRYDLRAQ